MAARARGVPSDGVTGFDVFRWAEDGDELVRKALDKFTRDIAFMIMNFQVIFDPELFAIGGGISRQPLLLTYIRKNLEYYRATKSLLQTKSAALPISGKSSWASPAIQMMSGRLSLILRNASVVPGTDWFTMIAFI